MSETPAEDSESSEDVTEPVKVEAPEHDSVEKGEPAPDSDVVRGDVELPHNEKYEFSQPPEDGQTFEEKSD